MKSVLEAGLIPNDAGSAALNSTRLTALRDYTNAIHWDSAGHTETKYYLQDPITLREKECWSGDGRKNVRLNFDTHQPAITLAVRSRCCDFGLESRTVGQGVGFHSNGGSWSLENVSANVFDVGILLADVVVTIRDFHAYGNTSAGIHINGVANNVLIQSGNLSTNGTGILITGQTANVLVQGIAIQSSVTNAIAVKASAIQRTISVLDNYFEASSGTEEIVVDAPNCIGMTIARNWFNATNESIVIKAAKKTNIERNCHDGSGSNVLLATSAFDTRVSLGTNSAGDENVTDYGINTIITP